LNIPKLILLLQKLKDNLHFTAVGPWAVSQNEIYFSFKVYHSLLETWVKNFVICCQQFYHLCCYIFYIIYDMMYCYQYTEIQNQGIFKDLNHDVENMYFVIWTSKFKTNIFFNITVYNIIKYNFYISHNLEICDILFLYRIPMCNLFRYNYIIIYNIL